MDDPKTHEDIKALQVQAAQLQDSVKKNKHKAWYQNASNFLSFVAITASVATFWVSQRAEGSKDIRDRQEQLDQLLTNLLGLDLDLANNVNEIADLPKKQMASGNLLQRRMIYLEEAEIIVDKLGPNVTPSECDVLAQEMLNISNFTKAEVYDTKAVVAAHDIVTKAIACRTLASLYFMQSNVRNIDRGRSYYQESIDAMKDSPNDGYSLYTLGFTYQTWGMTERANGFKKEGAEKFEQAEKIYSSLSPEYYMRKSALEALWFIEGKPRPTKEPPIPQAVPPGSSGVPVH